ncbi:MAG TPA: PAS domain S-box protein [Thermoanaerobaculia bacterium]|nr:PAS domain S-box protein [Thermoanaerobaculia bacterium]
MPPQSHGHLEQQLRDTEERYRLPFENAHVGMAIADRAGHFVRVNARFSEIVGWSKEELLARSFSDISRPSDNAAAIAAHGRLLAGQSDFEAYERRYIRKDSSIVWANVTLSAVRDAEQELAYIVGVVEDITDLRASQQKHSELARLGSIALSPASLGSLFTSAAEVIRDTLEADVAKVVKWADGRSLVVGGAGTGIDREAPPTVFADGASAMIRTAEGDLRPPVPGQDPGAATAVSILINAGEVPRWGELKARWNNPHRVTAADLDFIRALANLLGQAIERRRTEVELRIRASQQSAIAEIGRLTSEDVSSATLERACRSVMEGLGVEHVCLLEPHSDGWRVWAGAMILGEVPRAAEHAEEVMRSGEAELIRDAGDFCGIVAPLNRLGVLSCYTTRAKRFTPGDVQFVEAVAVIIADSIEREEARARIIESERRLRNVIDGASEIIFSVAPDGRILSLNPAWETITGHPAQDWIGKHFAELIPEEDRPAVFALFQSMAENPRSIRVQVRVQGKLEPVLLDTAASVRVIDGKPVEIYGFARDATEEHRLATKLEQAGRLASLGRLAATVAHEFNNVLMGISPFMELLRKEQLNERSASAVDQTLRAVSRGKRITEDILRFAQPAEPVMTSINVGSWIDALAGEAQSVIGSKYKVVVETESSLRIAADQHQLHQAFINLILNARDAMPEGGVITVCASRERPGRKFAFGDVPHVERYAHLVVADTGTGISTEVLDHIFEPLFTTKKTGTGLGLPVTRQVVTRHGGEIFVESKPGKGTRFHLFIPLTGLPQTAEAVHANAHSTRCRNVLLVEDEPSVAAGIAALLEAEGMTVKVVGTGAAVLPLLAVSRPDAVILDIGLPDVEGTRVYEWIAAEYPDLPVVFSSGHGDASKLEQYLLNPRVAFLLKPYEIDKLLETLDRVVG